MPKTAYSTWYRRELDVEQLVGLMLQVPPEQSIDRELAEAQREWIRSDIRCSSCGAHGAQIVRSARRKATNAAIRQAHFRFVAPDTADAHHPFCEFHESGDQPRQADALLDFASSKSEETRAVRALVCKGIEQKIFDQSRIREMRQWFFNLKAANRISLSVSAEGLDWAAHVHRHPSYSRVVYHPVHAQMPGFDWKQAARHGFTEQFQPLFEIMRFRGRGGESLSRAKDLCARFVGQEVFNPEALKPFYENALKLATFVGLNSGLRFGSTRPENYWHKTPFALLALCALVLFVADWDFDRAVEHFATILRAPEPTDWLQGNVIGLNPFHDYDVWRFVIAAQEVANHPFEVRNYQQELAIMEAHIRKIHHEWFGNLTLSGQ
jgi:hypothetical protein